MPMAIDGLLGRGGALLRTARILLGASAAAELLPLPGRLRRRVTGALALGGTLALRFGIVAAGRASALDPHATFALQRARGGGTEANRPQTGTWKTWRR